MSDLIVDRSELAERVIEATRETKLVHLCAPIGYGKSMLARTAAERLIEQGEVSVIWISVSRVDQSPAVFVKSIASACTAALSADGQRAKSLGLSGREGRHFYDLNTITKRLSMEGRRFVVVFDEYHEAAGLEADEVMSEMVKRSDANIRFILTSRNTPSGFTAKLRLSDELTEFAQSDLAFTQEEIAAAFGPIVGNAEDHTTHPSRGTVLPDANGQRTDSADSSDPFVLTIEELETLTNRVDGWPTALKLFNRHWRSSRNLSTAVSNFTGNSKSVVDYFHQECFLQLSDELRAFLLDVAVLDNVDADTVNELRGRGDSGKLINQLLSLNVAPVFSNDVRTEFQFHPLYSEFLMGRLAAQRDLERIKETHKDISRHYKSVGRIPEALVHAVKAGSNEAIADVLDDDGGSGLFWLTRDFETFRPLMRLRGRFSSCQFRLLPISAFFLATEGDLDNARSVLDDAKRCLAKSSDALSKSVIESINADILITEAEIALHAYDVDIDHFIDALERVRYRSIRTHPIFQAIVFDVLGRLYFRIGKLHRSAAAFDDAVAFYEGFHSYWGAACALLERAVVAIEQCEPGRAHSSLTRAQFFHGRYAPEDRALARKIMVVDARIKYLAAESPEDLNQSHSRITSAIGAMLKNNANSAELLSDAFRTLSFLEFGRNGLCKALQVLATGTRVANERDLGGLAQCYSGTGICVAAVAGAVGEAEQIIADAAVDFDDLELDTLGFGWRSTVEIAFGFIRVDIACGRTERANDRLSKLEQAANRNGFKLVALKCGVLRALCHFADKRSVHAARTLSSRLTTMESGLRAIFLEEGPIAQNLLEDWSSRIKRSKAGDRQLPALENMRVVASAFSPPAIEIKAHPPTGKSMEVLTLIAMGHRPRTVAPRVDMTESGVNYHLKELRQRLGVKTTPSLISEAASRGWLDGIAIGERFSSTR